VGGERVSTACGLAEWFAGLKPGAYIDGRWTDEYCVRHELLVLESGRRIGLRK